MGERKVINKYIPPDFDPSLVPRGTKLSKKDGTVPVRMMLPFSIQCNTCNTFMYRGKKFNSKKEAMGGPDGRYLGIQRWRFYIKCNHCSRPITFLTDPKNADYEMESGATRNYEVYKDKAAKEESADLEREEEEKIDPMKALENRVLDSQREMADLDNLEEIKAMNRRHVQLMTASGEGFDADAKALLERMAKQQKPDESELNEHGITADEEELIKSIKFGQAKVSVKRLNEEDEMLIEEKRKKELAILEESQRQLLEKTAKTIKPVILVKRKKPVANEPISKKARADSAGRRPSNGEGGGLAGLLGDYGSDSDSD